MESVILYITAFLIATLTAQVVQKKTAKVQRCSITTQILYSCCIMLAPMALACCRYGIGIDYNIYIDVFNRIHTTSLLDYHNEIGTYEYLNKPLVELGFLLTGNTDGVFSVYAIFTLLIYEMALLNFRKQISLPLATLLLLFLLYSASLNIVRQSLSIAVVFYSVKYVLERNIKNFLILIIIATGIHSSAFIAIFFYFLYSKDNAIKNKIIKIAIIIAPLAIAKSLSLISEFAIFERYFAVYDTSVIDISKSYIIKLPILIILLLAFRELRKFEITSLFYSVYIMEWTLMFSASIFKWAFRLTYYSYIGQIILLSMIPKKICRNAAIYNFAVISWYLIYFYVLYYIWGRDGIFPYKIR